MMTQNLITIFKDRQQQLPDHRKAIIHDLSLWQNLRQGIHRIKEISNTHLCRVFLSKRFWAKNKVLAIFRQFSRLGISGFLLAQIFGTQPLEYY